MLSVFGASKPLLLVSALIGASLGGMYFTQRSVMTDFMGKPLDFAGDAPPCPGCTHFQTERLGGYRYRCGNCGTSYSCRMPIETRHHDYFDVLSR